MASSFKSKAGLSTYFDFEKEYPMNHGRRGKALIFSHFQYLNIDMEERKGNEIDKQRVVEEFTKMGFEVELYEDYFEKKVMKKLKKVAQEDHSDADCLAVVVMSHGREVDDGSQSQKTYEISAFDKHYKDSKLFESFQGIKCSSLLGKPKLFFIQACRGQKRQGVQSVSTQWTGRERQGKAEMVLGLQALNIRTYQIPDNADFYIVRATFDGTVSRRHKEKGTVFIQALCDELKTNYEKENKEDLQTLMTFVTKKVAFNNPQMPTVFSTLTKKVYFRKKGS